MIARLDDIYHFQHADVIPNLEFPYPLKFKVGWSKNVLKERDAPDLIILWAMDPAFCPILVIAVHLVHPIHSGGMASIDNQSLFCVKKKEFLLNFKNNREWQF